MRKILVAAIAACMVAFAGSASDAGPISALPMKPGIDQTQLANNGVVLVRKRPGAGHRPHRPNRPHRHRHRRAGAVAAEVAAGVAIGAAATASRRNYCSRLAYRCNRGDLPACAEHDFNCLF